MKSRVTYSKEMRDKARAEGLGLLTFAHAPPAGVPGVVMESQMLVTEEEAKPFWDAWNALHEKRQKNRAKTDR